MQLFPTARAGLLRTERGGSRALVGGKDLDANPGDAVLLHAELRRRVAREVDDAARGIGPAVVDADEDPAPVAEVGDAGDRLQRQGAMRRGDVLRIERLAAGGRPALEAVAVPRRHADLEEARHAAGIKVGLPRG